MSKDASFDVVSEFDKQEMVNAIEQVRKEISSRFDLKDSGSEVDYKESEIVITAQDDMQVRNIKDILESKMIKRNLNILILDPKEPEAALGGRMRQTITLKQGISSEQAKKIVATIKNAKLKVQAAIQGEQVRVTGKSRDDLQDVIALLKKESEVWSLPLQFTNYR
jgi:cyclic-di-GMP-binding protein